MPDFSQFALFLAAGLVLAVTPGPGIFYPEFDSGRGMLAAGRRLSV
jgi:threonine/homoserine/homoserine lactone efflux protein